MLTGDSRGATYASGKASAAEAIFETDLYCDGEYDASVAYDDVL